MARIKLGNLKGPKGDTGLQGPQGIQGPKGEPFRYSDFTADQLASLKGPKGDKGEQGPAGTSANVDLSPYAKTVDLNKYRTVADGDNLYLKKADLRAYLSMIGDPIYLKKADAAVTYPTKTDADAKYLTKADFTHTINLGDYTLSIEE